MTHRNSPSCTSFQTALKKKKLLWWHSIIPKHDQTFKSPVVQETYFYLRKDKQQRLVGKINLLCINKCTITYICIHSITLTKKTPRVFQSLEYHIQSHKGKKDREWLGITSSSSWLKHKWQASQWQGVYLVLTLEPLRKILWGSGFSWRYPST